MKPAHVVFLCDILMIKKNMVSYNSTKKPSHKWDISNRVLGFSKEMRRGLGF
jgi:hypothetical protein